LSLCVRYRESIDAITVDKATKLRKYELDDGDWTVSEDLVAILKVCLSVFSPSHALTLL
jgi:hypothetical protein